MTNLILIICQDQKDFKLLRSSCSINEILEAMTNSTTGLIILWSKYNSVF